MEAKGNYDWRERHETFERELESLQQSIMDQRKKADRLLDALRDLIERIPPENLRQ